MLSRIKPSKVEQYAALIGELAHKQIANDPAYQRRFNDFYKMSRRKQDWYRYYFSFLQRSKTDSTITFQQVISDVYREKGRVEPSFSSKLVATIRPEKPVYDKHVRENLCLAIPGAHIAPKRRLEMWINVYASLEDKVTALVKDPIFTEDLKPVFDAKFTAYTYFTDVKKLDFLLWQHRGGQTNA